MKQQKKQGVYLAFTALAATGMVLALYIVLRIAPFGDNTVLTGDLNGQYIPYFSHYYRAVRGQSGFAMGLDKSLGGNLLGIFAYYCSSPFNLIYLLAPPALYGATAGLVLGLKLVGASVSFAFFAGRRFKNLGVWQVAMGVSYGFCAYALVYAQNIMWHDVVLLLPLVCYGIDCIVRKGRVLWFGITLALAIFSNFYIAYMACIFCVLYFLFCLITERPARPGRCCLQFGASALAAGLCSGVLLVPSLLNVNQSKGEIFSFSFSLEQNFDLWQLAQRMLPGNFVRADAENGLPNLYCGVLALVLLAMFFAAKEIALRWKLAGGGILALLILSFWIKGLDVFWHGMKAPVWFPYRYSFLFSFWVLFLGCCALAHVRLHGRRVWVAGGLLAAVFLLALFARAPQLSLKRLLFAAALAAAFFVLVWAAQAGRKAAALCCVALCAAELFVNARWVTAQFEQYPNSVYQSFLEDGQGTLDAIHAQDNDFYRVEKTSFRTMNDPMLLGYWGISHFGSTQDSASVELLYRLGYGNYTKCYTYLYGSTAAADALLGIRYLMEAPGARAIPSQYIPQEIDTPWPVYQNPCALPLAFPAPVALAQLALENGQNTFDWQQSVWRALTKDADGLFFAVDAQTQAADNSARYVFTAPRDGLYYAWMETVDNSAGTLLINGAQAQEYPTFEHHGVVQLGRWQAGQTVEVTLSAAVQSAMICGLDETVLTRACARINARAARITRMEDGFIEASAQAQKDEVLWLCVPYAQEWRATVNGAPVKPVALLDSLVGVPLTAGENEVRLIWHTSGTAAGAVLTGAGIGLLAALAWLQRKKQKRSDM